MDSDKKYAVKVDAQAFYLADHSDEDNDRYVFAYNVRITNVGKIAAKVVSRHWLITNATGEVQDVRGMGVIGEQPNLAPGKCFEYSSGSELTTDAGSMRGSYQMLAADGTRFEAIIPEFSLFVPRVLH